MHPRVGLSRRPTVPSYEKSTFPSNDMFLCSAGVWADPGLRGFLTPRRPLQQVRGARGPTPYRIQGPPPLPPSPSLRVLFPSVTPRLETLLPPTPNPPDRSRQEPESDQPRPRQRHPGPRAPDACALRPARPGPSVGDTGWPRNHADTPRCGCFRGAP